MGEEGHEHVESLLKRSYYFEGCPGCKVDHLKQTQTGLPIKQVLIVWIVVLSTGNSLLLSFC